jgi:MFS family permease
MATDVAAIQRRTLRILFATQITGAVGVAIGISVGALLTAELASVAVSGLAQSAAVAGAALLALPAARITRLHGRRPSLSLLYLVAALGGAIVVAAAVTQSVTGLFVGLFLFGGGTAAGLQARYTAVDLAPAALRGRHLSLVVWATTLGAVAGPNLAPLAGTSLNGFGIPVLAGPFVFSALLFILTGGLLLLLLRPDPLRVAFRAGPSSTTSTSEREPAGKGIGAALTVVAADPAARLGLAAAAVGHLVMIGVMAMTPVHIREAGHGPEATLRIVGIVLSMHIAGMFAFAPLTGWLSDRLGRRPVILGALIVLLAACAVAGSAGHATPQLALGLGLLGLGWSGTMVAGSTLLSESVPATYRTSAQGLSDLVMGLAGALSGAASGFVLDRVGYPLLAVLAGLTVLPLALLTLLSGRRTAAQD